MELIKEDFLDILENQRIKPVFQPIISLRNGEIIGYEALSRITEPKTICSSDELFRLAGLYGKLWELEQLCRRKILEKYHENADEIGSKKIFLNVSPMVIHDREFRSGFTCEYLKQFGIGRDSIIFEVTEKNAVEDVQGFKDTIRHYKLQGYTMAIDDAGSCYSGLNLICDVVPHYLKLDMSLIRDIDKDTIKYAMVKSMAEFAKLTDIQIIAEGIETEGELQALLNIGVQCGQGYFIRKPHEEFRNIRQEALDVINKYNKRRNRSRMKVNDTEKDLCGVVFNIKGYKSFTAYCEKYGDDKGDELLELFRNIIKNNMEDGETAVVLGKDKVMAAVDRESSRIKCEKIENEFEKESIKLYDEDDISNGYINGHNKHGDKKKYLFVEMESECLV